METKPNYDTGEDAALPCPHCAGNTVHVRQISQERREDMGYEVFAECHQCQSTGPYQWLNKAFFTHEQREASAIEQWNRREYAPPLDNHPGSVV